MEKPIKLTITGKVGTKSITKYVEVYSFNAPEARYTTMKTIREEFIKEGYKGKDVIFTIQ